MRKQLIKILIREYILRDEFREASKEELESLYQIEKEDYEDWTNEDIENQINWVMWSATL